MSGRALVFAVLLAVAGGAIADAPRLVIVSGLGGESYYSELFHRWATTLQDVAFHRLGLPASHVIRLAEDPSRATEKIDDVSSAKNVLDAVRRLAEDSGQADVVAIVYLGHASSREGETKLNLPGPDLSAAELAAALESLNGKTVAVVIAAPASAPFVAALSGPDRIVIAATAHESENQHTRFGGYFVDAFADDTADLNKDKSVSLLEAFRFASKEVARSFEVEGRIATEHAILDDNGDGSGSTEPDADTGDGLLAGRVHLRAPDAAETAAGAAALALQIQARQLVDRIEAIKREKRSLESDAYLERLEDLLVQLALNRRAYRRELVR